MGDCTVHMHVSPNGKKYVGITGQDVSRRRRDGEGRYGQTVHNAILKYGWDNITRKISSGGLTEEQAEEREMEPTERYRTTGRENGYNVELGGNATGKVSDESKRKNSESHKGMMAGERHRHHGRHRGDDVKGKISEAGKGRKISDGTRLGKSAVFSGKGNPMYGTKIPAGHRKKLQAACVKATSGPVVRIETGKAYRSAAQARRETGICPRTIGYVANRDKRYETAGVYHWEYREVS